MSDHIHEVMDRNIFNLKLSVEGVSAYILVTSLLGENVRPSLELIKGRWTTTQEALDSALAELVERNVLQPRTGPDKEKLYYPNPSSLWR